MIIEKNGKIYETNTDQQITQDKPLKVLKFSAFLGIINITNKTYIFCVDQINYAGTIEKHDIFEIHSIALVPITDNLDKTT